MSKKPFIDSAECIACGSCEGICPGVFKLNEELGYAVVIDPAGASEKEIQEAMDACPVTCIHWED
jgi:ferredoxin